MAPQTSSIEQRKCKVILRKKSDVEKSVDPVDKLVRRDFKGVPGAKPRPLIMGIDPGFSGAVAVVDIDRGTLVDMIDMPTYEKPTDARKQGFFQMLDVHKLSSLLDMYAPLTAIAVLEEPGAMPEQGLGSIFRFGHTCGQIHGVLAGHYIPVVPVKPAVWKNALALSHVKDESRLRATLEYPDFRDLWALKKHNDRAEAALLVTYARKYFHQLIELSRK